jgi:hypothetical protein
MTFSHAMLVLVQELHLAAKVREGTRSGEVGGAALRLYDVAYVERSTAAGKHCQTVLLLAMGGSGAVTQRERRGWRAWTAAASLDLGEQTAEGSTQSRNAKQEGKGR